MDGQQVRIWESRCIEEQPPACTAACPVHVDARGFIEHLRKDDFKAALAVYTRFVAFPAIIGRICDHPCESACRRGESGGTIHIHELERACVREQLPVAPFRVVRQIAPKRIAVVGAGVSGLSAAAELTIKGHKVVVFDAAPHAFDRLRAFAPEVLPAEAIDADLARFAATGIEWRLGAHVDLADPANGIDALVRDFDAVYLGVGPDPLSTLDGRLALDGDGRIKIDPFTFATSDPKVFAGGSHRYGTAYSPILSLQDGRYAALSIERLLQGASLTANRENQGAQPTRLYVNVGRHPPVNAVPAADPAAGYSHVEAVAEAARCFPCHCLECVRVCPYLEHYGAYPKRYIREIFNNETIVMGQRKANRMIDSCTLCGLCAAVCPEELGMGEVCLSARQGMTVRGKMPPSHHEFALRDMAFSRSDAFSMARHQPGFDRSAVVFFPGCQLSASSPDHVARAYEHLCERVEGGVGLMLGCCGAPAHWAGRQDLFAETRTAFVAEWERLGRPKVVTACSSCYRMFADHMPDVPLESMWPMLERIGLPAHAVTDHRRLAVHDPCTTRDVPAVQRSVRNLMAGQGVMTIDLGDPRLTSCCGFGGLASFVNPEIADKIVDRRIGESDADYLTYCAMCRDNFARRGKRAVHALDLLFGADGDPAARPDPGFSRRQENRGQLKRRLLREFWSESMDEPAKDIELDLSAEVLADLERKLILLDDVRATIRHAETTGDKLLDRRTGRFIASHRPVAITYWVEYTRQNGRYVVHRAYSHRMQLG